MSAVERDPARLLVTTPAWTREFPLDREVMVLGRDPGSEIPVDDQVVSRRHAELRRSGPGYAIVDLESLNGLVAGGQRFQNRVLQDGDEIWIGQRVTLTYRASAAELAPAVAEPVAPVVVGVAPPAAPAAAAPAAAAPPAGWYADPTGSSGLRYWDGRAWTEHRAAHPAMAAPPPPPAAQLTSPSGRNARSLGFLGAAAALVVVGSFLPWLGRDGRSTSSWDLPVLSLMKGQPAGGLRTGPLLLLVALVAGALAAVPYLMRIPPNPGIAFLIAVVPINAGIAAVWASLKATPHLSLGPGALLTLAGGLILAGHALVTVSRARAAARVGGS